MLLDYEGTVKIADFAGSSVDWCAFASSVDYEVGSKLPRNGEPTERTDIFALGSAIYEMMTRKSPYKGLHYTEVQRRFKQGKFPSDFGEFSQLGLIVEKCWGKGGKFYDSADHVVNDLFTLVSTSHTPACAHTVSGRKSNQPTQPTTCPTLSREISPEAPHSIRRRAHPEKAIYVNSHRNEKEIKRTRRTRRSQPQSTTLEDSMQKRHRTHKHVDSPMDNLVHMVQVLWSGHSRPLSAKKRDRH